MTRADLADALQKILKDMSYLPVSRRECLDVVDALFDEMHKALLAGEDVYIYGFGRLSVKEAINPYPHATEKTYKKLYVKASQDFFEEETK